MSLLTGIGLGAGLMWVLDPQHGRRRRARLRDRLGHAVRSVEEGADAAASDLQHRVRGAWAETWRRIDPNSAGVDDDTLVARVRSRLGRATSHPHAIEVSASGRRVTLKGPVLRHELRDVIQAAAAVRGVTEIDNQLEAHEDDNRVSALQGGVDRPRGRRWTWSPAASAAAAVGGAALVLDGWRRGGLGGLLGELTGLGLITSAVERGGPPRGPEIVLHKALHIEASPRDVYALWSRVERFPEIMQHVLGVRPEGGQRTRWRVAGPLGIPLEWQAEVVRAVEGELIEWRTVPGTVPHIHGLVRFAPEGDGTRVSLEITYVPPLGVLGHLVGRMLAPKRQIDDDMVRFKSLFEQGRATVHGRTVTRESLPS